MNELHLFAGSGGGILGGLLLGHRPVCAVEIEPYPRRVLLQRQRDGVLPRFPIWDDVRTFDGKPWRGKVDVVCGGFPCQDISSAGRGKGIAGERSGLWSEMQRVICDVGPSHVFVENSPLLTRRGLALVISDLAKMGYDAKWCVLGSDSTGGCHHRKRIWVLASDPKRVRSSRSWGFFNGEREKARDDRETDWFKHILQGKAMPYVCGENHGMADSVDRTKAIGNGQDPRVAKLAWELMTA